MPRIRPEQIANFGISDLQIAVNAAIKQSKIADQIADPQGWVSKGTINVVDSFSGSSAGYQEFGMSINSEGDSGLVDSTVYYFEVNGIEYAISTSGKSLPISYSTVVTLMEAEVTANNLSVSIVGNDIRVSSTVSGYDKNVSLNQNCTRHRLHEYLAGFTAFDDPVKGTGITWDASTAGRIFFAKDTNETYIGTSTDPYYQALASGGGESQITTIETTQAVDYDGTTATTFRSDHGFAPDGTNMFAYLNGQLLEYGPGGNNDYQIVQGNGTNGEYTDVVLNSSFSLGNDDKVTIIVYSKTELSSYATKAYVNNKLSNSVELDGDTTIDGNIIPGQNALHNIGTPTDTWKSIYLNDSIYFDPIGTGDTARIYRSVTGEDTQMKFMIGSSANDKIIFEDENNTVILSIDGDGGCTIPGDLTVQGTTNYANEQNTTITDADFVIKDTTTPADGDASYSVERANGNVSLKWNDSIDRWQAVYGSTANITSDILTQDDLASGKNLDARYVTQSQVVASGSTENDGAIKYIGVHDDGTGLVDGTFYSGLYKPTSLERLNYNGHLYVTAITADDVYVSANSLYINGKKAIEDTNNVMTFRADQDQSITLKTLGTGDIFINSGDLLQVDSTGDMSFTVASTFAGKHMDFINDSATGDIRFNDSFQTSAISFSQTNADGFATEFAKTSQTLFDWTVRDTDTASITSLMGGINTNRQDLYEYVELVGVQGAGIGTAAGANLVGVDGIAGVTPVNGTLGSDGNLQEVLEGMVSSSFVSDVSGNLTLDNSNNITINSNAALNLMGGSGGFNIYGEGESNINVLNSNLLVTTTGSTTPGDISFTSVGSVDFEAATYIGFTASDSNFTGTVEIGSSGALEGGQSSPSGSDVLGYNGYFYATRVYNAVYNDMAEFMPSAETCKPGEVLVQTSEGVKPASQRGDGAVVGVYSDSYGYALGGDENTEGKVPVGLSGRVWVWIEEPCSIGNLLITSDKKGFATVKRSGEDGLGKVFAKVMEDKLDSTPQRIEVLILMA